MKNLLSKYKPMADAIANLFQPYVEVVIHDIDDRTIFYIANPSSGRVDGDPSYFGWDDGEYNILLEKNIFGPYEKEGIKGQRLRCITTVLRDDKSNPIGTMCINFNCSPLESAFDSAFDLLNRLIRPIDVETPPEILFREEWRERIMLEIRTFFSENGKTQESMNTKERRELMKRLEQKRLFYTRKSVEKVSQILKISRTTVYSDLKMIRKEKL